ncbi:MAG: response regulator [Thaumarchaeota archaeon]|nr:response regulator [Nitrososphaerota archaeon]
MANNKKILLIDDNVSITDMISKYLTFKNYDCTTCNDGRNGLTLIEQGKFDIILLDLAMPDFTGIDIIDHLYKSGKIKEQKIILFTASSVTDAAIEDLIQKGAHSCIKKPVHLQTLVQILGD